MTKAQFAARIGAQTSMAKDASRRHSQCRALRHRRWPCQRRDRDDGLLRDLVDEGDAGPQGPQSPVRRNHLHCHLEQALIQGWQDPSHLRQLAASASAGHLSQRSVLLPFSDVMYTTRTALPSVPVRIRPGDTKSPPIE